MTDFGDVLRKHHRILLSVTVHSSGDTSMTTGLVIVTVGHHRSYSLVTDARFRVFPSKNDFSI
jgi:hypothetical protein